MIINKIINDDAYKVLQTIPDCSIDAIVTDPPYGLSKEPNIYEVLEKWMNNKEYKHPSNGFNGNEWDSFVPNPLFWKEVYRVLKPGGHLISFSSTRTYDLLGISLRLSGFEIRDMIEWLYFNGMVKSNDIGKMFDKKDNKQPETIGFKVELSGRCMAIEPKAKEIKCNPDKTDRKYGVDNRTSAERKVVKIPTTDEGVKWDGWGTLLKSAHEPMVLARKPLEKVGLCENVLEYGTGALNIDECRFKEEINHDVGVYKKLNLKHSETINEKYKIHKDDQDRKFVEPLGRFPTNCITLENNEFYSEFYNITPKPLSKKPTSKDKNSNWQGDQINLKNNHVTVKPVDLMAWLIKLITPKNGIVLDPFAGSGTTLVAAKREGFNFIGIEMDEKYAEIATERIK
ncbi:site-specific DNA-methyltransferase [Fictibacillus nanhaiensis]|uniref:DNA-methyltransferase n=1 Tax=Fictibacillus nanhaiensis TaxID=742169 RepID=UPI002E1D5D3A|nr:site-specific DNA-methyltransferase [Fictibacillus nanhaiensis]